MSTHASDTSMQFDMILPAMIAANSKQMTRLVAREITGLVGINDRILAERLLEKEKQNPSTMGDGVSITHMPVSGLSNAVNIFVRLKNPVDMKAADKKPVDIVVILLTPEREGAMYLRTLARVSRLLRNASICARLRKSANEKELRAVLDQSSVQLATAA